MDRRELVISNKECNSFCLFTQIYQKNQLSKLFSLKRGEIINKFRGIDLLKWSSRSLDINNFVFQHFDFDNVINC